MTIPITPERLNTFFHPRSIALVGATDNSRWSLFTYQNLKAFGFPGPIYCVNPNREIVHGERAVKRLADIPEPVDMAFVMVSTQLVCQIIEEAAEVGITNVVILTAGFREMGEQGAQLEQQLLDLAERHHMLILGPNGNGFVNLMAQTVPYGLLIQQPLAGGPVGVVLQSGALASVVIALSQARHIGLSLLVSMGNEAMLSVTDIIDYLLNDEQTRVIALFLESVRQPEAFERVARKALAMKKPIVALKVGRSEQGARAALAHTGALVGDDAITDAVFKQLGIIRVHSLEELLTTAGLLGYSRPLAGRRMGLVTPSGGACEIMADRAKEEGIQLPDFAPKTVERLRQILPAFATARNPLDVTGFLVVDRMLQYRALELVIDDPHCDFLVYTFEPPRVEPATAQWDLLVEPYVALGELVRTARIPVIVSSNTSIDLTPFARFIADRTGMHFLGGMDHGMTALGHALWWYERSREEPPTPQQDPAGSIGLMIPGKLEGNWPEYVARKVLRHWGIPVVPEIRVSSEEAAVSAALTFGSPVAMKIQAHNLVHKSDVGGVILDVAGEEAVRQAFRTIMDRARHAADEQDIYGILVSPMRSNGVELLVGIVRDELWGLVLTLGLGGIWTEVFHDTAIRVLPVQPNEIQTMLGELRAAPLLQGMRGHPPVDIHVLCDVIYRLTLLARSLAPHLQTLEINPLWINGSQVEVLDALVNWQT